MSVYTRANVIIEEEFVHTDTYVRLLISSWRVYDIHWSRMYKRNVWSHSLFGYIFFFFIHDQENKIKKSDK